MATDNKNCQLFVKSLKWCQGKSVKPGIRRRVAVISADQVLKCPSYQRDDIGRVTSADLQGSFDLVEGAKWAIFEHIPEKASFKSDSQGEYPSQTFKVSVSIVHPGVGKEAAEATACLLNANVYVLVEDMDGNWRWVGNEDGYMPTVTIGRDNGQGATGTAGTTITVEQSMEFDAAFYSGPIETEDGTINEPTAGA